ncbi:unnamed protein product [Moneuplotes crassus]|uniref:Uncharacterized protein n=1 Tax=Euplotes crassus TaxID=5936 RepID=A0AAD2D7W6_EUPCR|nr:unnamed protein product [Moneuplotes crassus]
MVSLKLLLFSKVNQLLDMSLSSFVSVGTSNDIPVPMDNFQYEWDFIISDCSRLGSISASVVFNSVQNSCVSLLGYIDLSIEHIVSIIRNSIINDRVFQILVVSCVGVEINNIYIPVSLSQVLQHSVWVAVEKSAVSKSCVQEKQC